MTEYTDFEYTVSPRRCPAVKYHSSPTLSWPSGKEAATVTSATWVQLTVEETILQCLGSRQKSENTFLFSKKKSTTPLTVELTCTEVRYRNGVITSSPSLPDKSTANQSGFNRLKQSNEDVAAVEISRGPNETTVTSSSSEPTIKYF